MAAGVVAAAAGTEAGVAVAAAAAFFECFFAGVAEASGLGLGVVSAALTRGAAAKAAVTISIIRERMLAFLGNLIAFGKAFIPAAEPGGGCSTAEGTRLRRSFALSGVHSLVTCKKSVRLD